MTLFGNFERAINCEKWKYEGEREAEIEVKVEIQIFQKVNMHRQTPNPARLLSSLVIEGSGKIPKANLETIQNCGGV